jgi:hypothetical protein
VKKISLKSVLLVSGLLFFCQLFAQQAVTFNYQAVIRKADGTLVQSQQVSVIFTIQGEYGTILYMEEQNSLTDVYGVVNLLIGEGTPIAGILEDINWAARLYLNVDVDIDDDGTADLIGTSLIASVPKAGFAQKAAVADALSYELATVALSGDYNDLINKPSLLENTAPVTKNGTDLATGGQIYDFILQYITDSVRGTEPLVFEKELTDNENDINVGFPLNANALILINGQAIPKSQWTGVGTETIHLSLTTKSYDNIMIKTIE